MAHGNAALVIASGLLFLGDSEAALRRRLRNLVEREARHAAAAGGRGLKFLGSHSALSVLYAFEDFYTVTFGERYNLTGGDYFSQEGYVDEFGRLLGHTPDKVFIPPAMMEDLWLGRLEVKLPKTQTKADTRSGHPVSDHVQTNRFMLTMLVQQIAPNIHHWDRSTLFSVEKLRRHVGWEPELTFKASVERTWRGYQAAGLDKTQQFDFTFEDELIRMARERQD